MTVPATVPASTAASGRATRALVLGGGGLTGIAWEAGVLCGFGQAGFDPDGWDVVIGSSAGSFVGAWLRSGRIVDLYERQVRDDAAHVGRGFARAMRNRLLDAVRIGRRRGLGWLPRAWTVTAGAIAVARYALARGPRAVSGVVPGLRALACGAGMSATALARVGELAVTVSADDGDPRWVEHWAHLLGPAAPWPADPLIVTAIDLASGGRACFGRSSRTTLARAVAASTAIPLVVDPITINGRRYGDGSTGSPTNADLAAGHDQVLILAPVGGDALASEVAALEARGTRAVVLRPGRSADILGAGVSALDPRRVEWSARTGRDDGTRFAKLCGDGLLER